MRSSPATVRLPQELPLQCEGSSTSHAYLDTPGETCICVKPAAGVQDNEAVLELLVQRGEWHRALAVLRQPNLSQELMYKFAPSLMANIPAETVSCPRSSASPALTGHCRNPGLARR